jgi:hypothetical protein
MVTTTSTIELGFGGSQKTDGSWWCDTASTTLKGIKLSGSRAEEEEPQRHEEGETEVTHSATPTHIEWVKQPFAKRTWATQPRSPKL